VAALVGGIKLAKKLKAVLAHREIIAPREAPRLTAEAAPEIEISSRHARSGNSLRAASAGSAANGLDYAVRWGSEEIKTS